jgi:hypothetical protein
VAPPAVPVLTATAVPAFGLVRLAATFGATTTELDIYRVGPSGTLAYVRGVAARDVAGTTALDTDDLEAPLGVQVTYRAVARNADGETLNAAAIAVTLTGEDDWLVDLDSAGNSGPVLVESFAELDYAVPQGVHQIIGRRSPIVTSGIRATPTSDLVVLALTDDDAERLRRALTGVSPVLLRTPVDRGVGNAYLQVGSLVEQRLSRLAVEPSRRFRAAVQQIERPDPAVFEPVFVSYGDVAAEWATYTAMMAARADYGALLVDRTGIAVGGYSTEPPFPPRDV